MGSTSILYPSVGLLVYGVPDTELVSSIFRAYNDWLAEYCQPFPGRLKSVAMVNVDDVGAGVRELQRCARMGLVGGMITVYPPKIGSTTLLSTSRCGLRPGTWVCH